ncbi:hypothetical protein DR94_1229 [Proteus mirabilis]|nr:hypothetical protein DR94_1229 [Proteus mirabilis]
MSSMVHIIFSQKKAILVYGYVANHNVLLCISTPRYQHAVIEVGSYGSGVKIAPMRWQLTVLLGPSVNSSTDDVVQYIDINEYQ